MFYIGCHLSPSAGWLAMGQTDLHLPQRVQVCTEVRMLMSLSLSGRPDSEMSWMSRLKEKV